MYKIKIITTLDKTSLGVCKQEFADEEDNCIVKVGDIKNIKYETYDKDYFEPIHIYIHKHNELLVTRFSTNLHYKSIIQPISYEFIQNKIIGFSKESIENKYWKIDDDCEGGFIEIEIQPIFERATLELNLIEKLKQNKEIIIISKKEADYLLTNYLNSKI